MTDHGRRDLISSWLDGRLSAEESARLEQDLLHSRAARDEFRAWADLDSLLVQQAEAGQNNSGQNNSNHTGQSAQVAMPAVRQPWWIAAAAGSAAAVIATAGDARARIFYQRTTTQTPKKNRSTARAAASSSRPAASVPPPTI